MSETQSPSEYDALMDNLDVVVNMLDTAKQRNRDRIRRRALPQGAPERPDGAPAPEDIPSTRERMEGSPRDGEERPMPPDPSRRRGPDQEPLPREEQARVREQGDVAREASADTMELSPEEVTALTGHLYWYSDVVYGDNARFSGWERERAAELYSDPTFAGDEEAIEQEMERTRSRIDEILERNGAEAEHAGGLGEDIERTRALDLGDTEAVRAIAASFDRPGWSLDDPDNLPPENLRRVMQAVDGADMGAGAVTEEGTGAEVTQSEIVVPLDMDEIHLDDEQFESVQQTIKDMGAELREGEIVIPFEARGDDHEVEVDKRVSIWRRVDARQIVDATAGRESMNTLYLKGGVDEDGAVSVPASQRGERPARILAEDDGSLRLEEAVVRDDLRAPEKALAAEHYQAQFVPRDGALWFPIERDASRPLDLGESRERRPGNLSAFEDASPQAISAVAAGVAARDAVDLVERHGPDGQRQAAVWVDPQRVPTTHPDGVPSVWFDEDGKPSAFGHYQDGEPSGEWAWTDESHGFVSDRAQMHQGEAIPGTAEHRDSQDAAFESAPEDGIGAWSKTLPGQDSAGAAQELQPDSGRTNASATSATAASMPAGAPAHRPSGPRPR